MLLDCWWWRLGRSCDSMTLSVSHTHISHAGGYDPTCCCRYSITGVTVPCFNTWPTQKSCFVVDIIIVTTYCGDKCTDMHTHVDPRLLWLDARIVLERDQATHPEEWRDQEVCAGTVTLSGFPLLGVHHLYRACVLSSFSSSVPPPNLLPFFHPSRSPFS